MTDGPSFLLVRFSAIGDCVMAAWAATAIRNKHPQAKLVWAVETRCASVVEVGSLVDTLAEFPRDRWKKSRWSPATWREQILAFVHLRRDRFDVGFDLQGHSKTALCLRIANPTRRVSARATDAFAARLNPPIGVRPDGMHTVDWYGTVLKSVDEYELPERPIMPRVEPKTSDRTIVTISVGAGQPDKAYPAEGFKRVACALMDDGMEVQFLGGPTDAPIIQSGAVDLVGKLPLGETMACVAQSAVHIAADTGTGHMAAAFGVPVVSIFGPKDPREFRPYTDRGVVLKEGSDPALVSAEAIVQAARGLLAK